MELDGSLSSPIFYFGNLLELNWREDLFLLSTSILVYLGKIGDLWDSQSSLIGPKLLKEALLESIPLNTLTYCAIAELSLKFNKELADFNGMIFLFRPL